MRDAIQEIEIGEFVRRLKRMLTGEALVSFFIGAGTSRSSGIQTAAPLTDQWLHQLHRECAPKQSFIEWAGEEFEGFNPDDTGALYSEVMARLFPTAADRQEEIERLVTHKDPGFGYATFAQLLADPERGPRCNVVFTTNFDDLVADALYLYTRTKPLVVTHASLADFAASGRTRPTIIKLHGDAMLAPLNNTNELAKLHENYYEILERQLRDRALIFVGYGGHDEGVTQAIKRLPPTTISRGLYWIGDRVPDTDLGQWLRARKETFWVPHLDFDELMAVVKVEFGLENPDRNRFDKLLRTYEETFTKLSGSEKKASRPEIVSSSVAKTGADLSGWVAVETEAEKYRTSEPARADEIYREGLKTMPTSPELLGNYGAFLHIRQDFERAEKYFKRAIEADGSNAINVGNYASFLHQRGENDDRAEDYYRQALMADPSDANNLGNYANFLQHIRKNPERADEYYRQALAADPTHANNLGNYANFLHQRGDDDDRAEDYYQQALTTDPSNANNLGNYANFLVDVRNDGERADEYFRRALIADPTHANNLGNYATFLYHIRNESELAENYFVRALTADPTDANSLVNFAGFLWATGRSNEARQRLDGFSDSEENPAWTVEIGVYRLANDGLDAASRRAVLRDLRALLLDGARTPGWTFEPNITRAELDGATADEISFLRALADVATDEAPIESLDQFEQWSSLA